MFTFLATIFSIKWISEHSTEIIIGIVIIVFIISLAIRERRKAIRQAYAAQLAAQEKARQEQQKKLEKQFAEAQAAIAEAEALAAKTAQLKNRPPEEIDGKNIMYQYNDVVIIPDGDPGAASAGDNLELKDDGESICVKTHGILIGKMKDNRLAGMVRDWKEANDPVKAYSVDLTDEGPVIALYFYGDAIGKFLGRKPEAKLIKLNGKQDDLAFYSKGVKCEAEYDDESEKYHVMCNGDSIGTLPASAIRYAEDHNISPEYLDIIIADVDYDIEKERDIISVYISD